MFHTSLINPTFTTVAASIARGSIGLIDFATYLVRLYLFTFAALLVAITAGLAISDPISLAAIPADQLWAGVPRMAGGMLTIAGVVTLLLLGLGGIINGVREALKDGNRC